MTKQEFLDKVAAHAQFHPGQEVCVLGAFLLGRAPGEILRFQMGHTHGGTQENSWWNRHEEACFSPSNVSYTVVWGYNHATDTAELRADFPASMLCAVKSQDEKFQAACRVADRQVENGALPSFANDSRKFNTKGGR